MVFANPRNRYVVVLALLTAATVLLSSCGRNSGETAASEQTDTQTAEQTAVPTEDPTPEPTEVLIDTPTPEPTATPQSESPLVSPDHQPTSPLDMPGQPASPLSGQTEADSAAEAIFAAGSAFLAEGDYEAALALYDGAIADGMLNPRLFEGRGDVNHELHRYPVAIEDYTKALEQIALEQLALEQEKLEQEKRAQEERAQEERAQEERAQEEPEQEGPEQEEPEQGLLEQEELEEVDPLSLELAALLVKRCASGIYIGRFEESIRDCEQSLDINPNQTDAYLALADLHHEDDKEHIARSLAQTSLTIDETGRAYAVLGSIDLDQERWKDALTHLSRSIEIDPTHHDAYWNRSMLYLAAGEIENAVNDMQSILDISTPKKHGDWMFRASSQIQMLTGEYPTAE